MGVSIETPWWGKVRGAVRGAPLHLRMNDLDYGYATACKGRQMGGSFINPPDWEVCPQCWKIYETGKERGLWL